MTPFSQPSRDPRVLLQQRAQALQPTAIDLLVWARQSRDETLLAAAQVFAQARRTLAEHDGLARVRASEDEETC